MALLQYHAPVNYDLQIEAFKDFLQNFKSFESPSEDAAAEAIGDLNLDGDGTSDEYDFMDDAQGDSETSRRQRRTKRKYMTVLQDIADRVKSNILIELDDLDVVGFVRADFRSISS